MLCERESEQFFINSILLSPIYFPEHIILRKVGDQFHTLMKHCVKLCCISRFSELCTVDEIIVFALSTNSMCRVYSINLIINFILYMSVIPRYINFETFSIFYGYFYYDVFLALCHVHVF
jgi:hypothetical protein